MRRVFFLLLLTLALNYTASAQLLIGGSGIVTSGPLPSGGGSPQVLAPVVTGAPSASSNNGAFAGALLSTNTLGVSWINCGTNNANCTIGYQWYSSPSASVGVCGTPGPIVGETSPTHLTSLTTTSIGRCYFVAQTATNSAGSASTGLSAPVGPLVATPTTSTQPTITSSNTTVAGAVLTASVNTVSLWTYCVPAQPCTFSYQWYSGFSVSGTCEPTTAITDGTGTSQTYTTPLVNGACYQVVETATTYTGLVGSSQQSVAFGPMGGGVATYYVDSVNGSDSNDGQTPTSAWQTISHVNAHAFNPGDTVLFNGGQTFSGSLNFTASSWTGASATSPVTIGSYGTGNATISSGTSNGFSITNNAGVVVQNLIFTGSGSGTANGVYALNNQAGNTKLEYLNFNNLTISGYGQNGLLVDGENGSSGFDNVNISYVTAFSNTNGYTGANGSSGIQVISLANYGTTTVANKAHTNVTIDHCVTYNNPGNASATNWTGSGIFVGETNGATVQYSLAYNNSGIGGGAVGIWAFDSNNATLQYNESYGTKRKSGAVDGDGFDLDGGVTNSVMQYNYSHDNAGMGLQVYEYTDGCTTHPGCIGPNSGNIVRYNISQHDATAGGTEGSLMVGNDGDASATISSISFYGNTIYSSVSGAGDVYIEGSSTTAFGTVNFSNNVFYAAGSNLGVSNATSAVTNVTFTGNDYFPTGAFSMKIGSAAAYTSLSAMNTAGYEKVGGVNVGFNVNPIIINAGSGVTTNNTPGSPVSLALNYQLENTSTLIATGQTITSPGSQDFFGNTLPASGFNIGAYQGSGTTGPAPVASGLPTITSNNSTNETASLTASDANITWANCSGSVACTKTFQWYTGTSSSGTCNATSPISGANSNTLTTSGAGGECYQVLETATSVNGSGASSLSTAFGPMVVVVAAIPANTVAPTFSATPTYIQNSSAIWTGNTFTVNPGTWNNCSSCTYQYQIYHWCSIPVLVSSTNSYTLPGTGTTKTPSLCGDYTGFDYYFAVVTAVNSAGGAVAATAPVTTNVTYVMTGVGGTISKCTDFTCTSTSPITNKLAQGDWVVVTGYDVNDTYGLTTKTLQGFSWSGDATGIASQAWVSSNMASAVSATQAGGTATYTLTTPLPNGMIYAGSTTFISGFTGANASYNGWKRVATIATSGANVTSFTVTGVSTSLTSASGFVTTGADRYQLQASDVGKNLTVRATWFVQGVGSNGTSSWASATIVGPATLTGGTISPPTAATVGTLAETPAVGSFPGLIPAYVGFVLDATTNSSGIPGGAWTSVSTKYTFQWKHCNSACTTPAVGASLSGTAIPGATASTYSVTNADLGKQIYPTITACNSVGCTSQDSAPTAAVSYPGTPKIASTANNPQLPNLPTITGLPTVGSLGGGPSEGSTLVAWTGVWAGPPTSYQYKWYSCPPATPNCLTPATGNSGQGSGFHPGQILSFYTIIPADLGNVLRFSVVAFNLSSLNGVPQDAIPTAPVTAFTVASALPAGPLKVYPANRDPNNMAGCTQPPTTYANTYYVNNATGSDTNPGTSSQPWLTIAHGVSTMQPGDRLLLQGTGAYGSAGGTAGNYGGLSVSGTNTDSNGNTKWKTIGADTGSGSQPMITNLSVSGRGWNFDGLTMDRTPGLANITNVTDFIYQNGRMGNFPDWATAQADYTNDCINGSCTDANFAAYVFNRTHSQFNVASGTKCVAFDNNKIWFSGGGISTGFGAQDVLIEGNDVGYITNDAFDANSFLPTIFHSNYVHDALGAGNPAIEVHIDHVQMQVINNNVVFGGYGLEVDSDVVINNADANIDSYTDTKYCTTIGQSPCQPISDRGVFQCFQPGGHIDVGDRFVNNTCVDTGHAQFFSQTLLLGANNTVMTGDTGGSNPITDSSSLGGNYWVNNAADAFSCGDSTQTWSHNVLLPTGFGGPFQSTNCTTGVTKDTSGINPFTSTWLPGQVWAPAGSWTPTTSNPSTLNLVPGSGSALLSAGVAGTGIPTVNAAGAARSNPPNVGAW